MVTEHIHVESLPAALADQRIDRIVSVVADVPRSQAAALIDSRDVLVDGLPADKPSLKVPAGSSIEIAFERISLEPTADPSVEIVAVHVDKHVVVVDKAPDVVVHPGSGVKGATLVNGLLARFPDIAGVGEPERPGIVHRLDRGTSGLLMVARDDAALISLSSQLRDRSVDRQYRALVLGHVDADAGVIDAPLGRSSRDATRRAVVAGGRPARTHYEVLERSGGVESDVDSDLESDATADVDGDGEQSDLVPEVTLITCRLETGRTHQIRAHFAAIGHPVLGDIAYGGSVAGTIYEGVLSRPFLHAEMLGFDHPVTGDRLRFTSPIPADLEAALRVGGQAA